jgi:hypothetical protein
MPHSKYSENHNTKSLIIKPHNNKEKKSWDSRVYLEIT